MNPLIKKFAIILAFFIVTGVVRARWESSLESRLTESGLLRELPPGISLKQRVRQDVLAALFGRLRSIMAVYWTLAGMEAWGDKDWPAVEKHFRMANDLDPDDVDLWSFAAWHLETNAASYWIMREDLPESVRSVEARQWIDKGIDVLNRGLGFHPESTKLHSELAKTLLEKTGDPCLAADHYRQARDGDAPMGYLDRFYPYALARCPGREKEAYAILKELYDQGKSQRLPTLIKLIKDLEEDLEIPMDQRIPDPDPDIELLKKYPHAEKNLPFSREKKPVDQ